MWQDSYIEWLHGTSSARQLKRNTVKFTQKQKKKGKVKKIKIKKDQRSQRNGIIRNKRMYRERRKQNKRYQHKMEVKTKSSSKK